MISVEEIRSRAFAFAKEWKDAKREAGESVLFWSAFLNVFGVTARRVGVFERAVKKLNDKTGRIDLLWPGKILVEHKSRGLDLDSAFQQATGYAAALHDHELPKAILVSDFDRVRCYDLEDPSQDFEIHVADLPRHIGKFIWLAGYKAKPVKPHPGANIKAAERMGDLHDLMKAKKFTGHDLEVVLVRLLFCMFADGTGIFEDGQFLDFIETQTREDGSDLGDRLAGLFEVLNTAPADRPTLDACLAAFPHVNGGLFKERLGHPVFDRKMRKLLIDLAEFNWGEISPAIFGSLFQSIMDLDARHDIGAHYTSEENILKVVGSLFMDGLRAEFEAVKTNRTKLEAFHKSLGSYRFLDPACGCGNFLVVAYRELCALEIEVLEALHIHTKHLKALLLAGHTYVSITQFYGMEIEEFPAQIALTAMWLVEHQMNMRLSALVGEPIVNIPLVNSATILRTNALRKDWSDLFPEPLKGVNRIFVFGNPPFLGSKVQSAAQKADVGLVWKGMKNASILDYVACWYRKAVDLMETLPSDLFRCAFVSTSSITQGEQVEPLWGFLLDKGIHIDFAHRTFQWSNEGRGAAAVHCVIIGFSKNGKGPRTIYDYPTLRSTPHAVVAKNISPYLIDHANTLIAKRRKPLCATPKLGVGCKPIDDGNYLFSADEKDAFIEAEPKSAPFFRQWFGSREFINGEDRWYLFLQDASPTDLRKLPESCKRIAAVKTFRLASTDAGTRKLANTPTAFHVDNRPSTPFIIIPRHSSENRALIPMGLLPADTLVGDSCLILPSSSLYHLGILQSSMHMAWLRTVGGRLESRYRYSAGLVYNSFSWPKDPGPRAIQAIETAAQGVLDARASFPGASLADLYDPNAMPPALARAHAALDKAVDRAYAADGWRGVDTSDLARAKFLFEQYDALIASLPSKPTPRTPRRAATAVASQGAGGRRPHMRRTHPAKP